MSAESFSAIAASLSCMAACASVLTAWLSPRAVARLVNRLQRETYVQHETQRMRLWIFTTLMQERASFHTGEGVKALNLIDTAFADQVAVREAWVKLLESLQPLAHASEFERKSRMRDLLQLMAASLGLCGRLGISDLDRIYVPEGASGQQLRPARVGATTLG